MKKFDKLGLDLAELQGKIFEKSFKKYNCSSLVFLRRFKYSKVAMTFDNNSSNILLDSDYWLNELENEFGQTNYGQIKFSEETLFWMGYIYRYISYTREMTTKKAFSLISPKELAQHYYVYHTQSEEWVIQRILDLKNKDESFFDKNAYLKEKLRPRYKTC